ncbi:chromosome-associated kinesin KIF4B-like [Ooceraea biroi]|uniref:chromosome-associated kinesin KIF4B-like n=1 Tax=Ooceraea biroi TaxID=2015173 RepID=UPI000F07A912|nr:chromosome-associated kinesin KIF4B-like [Ooceraea biroi]
MLRESLKELENKVSHITQNTSQLKSPNVGRCRYKGNCASRICGCVKKENICNSSCKCDNTMCQNQEMKHSEINKENVDKNDRAIFDPMKPKYQLSRTPPNKKVANEIMKDDNLQDLDDLQDAIKSQSQRGPYGYRLVFTSRVYCESTLVDPHSLASGREKAASQKVVQEEAVDWEQHTAQLIRCKKCKRTFIQDRIQKHETCKKI